MKAALNIEATPALTAGPGAEPVSMRSESAPTTLAWVEEGVDTVEEPKRRNPKAERAAFCALAAPTRRRPRRPNRKDPWPPQIPPLPQPCQPFPEPRIPPIPDLPRR